MQNNDDEIQILDWNTGTGPLEGYMRRPDTLKAAVTNHNGGHRRWDYTVQEWMDEFYLATEPEERAAMLADEPPMVKHWQSDEDYIDFHIMAGAIAEQLSREAGIDCPSWAFSSDRYSATPIRGKRFGYAHADGGTTYDTEDMDPAFVSRNLFLGCADLNRVSRLGAYVPEQMEVRRLKTIYSMAYDARRGLAMMPVLLDPSLPDAEVKLRESISRQTNQPFVSLETALHAHGVAAKELSLDLGPPSLGENIRTTWFPRFRPWEGPDVYRAERTSPRMDDIFFKNRRPQAGEPLYLHLLEIMHFAKGNMDAMLAYHAGTGPKPARPVIPESTDQPRVA